MAKKVSIIIMQNKQVTKSVTAPNALTHVIETHEYTSYTWVDEKKRVYVLKNEDALGASCLAGMILYNKDIKAPDANRRVRVEITSTEDKTESEQSVKYWHICDCENIFPIFTPIDTLPHTIYCVDCGATSAHIQEVKK